MNFSVYVFSDEIAKGQIKFDIVSLHKFFASVDCLCEKLVFFDYNKDKSWQLLEENLGKESQIVLLENLNIDEFSFSHIEQLGKYIATIEEQALIFEKDGKKIIFLPLEGDYLLLLSKIVKVPDGRKIYSIKVYGRSKEEIINDLDEIKNSFMGLEYKIFYDNLIYEIFFSYFGENCKIDDVEVKIASKFKEVMFSDNGLSLEQTIFKLLRLKNLKIAIYDGATGGYIENRFLSLENFDEVVKNSKIQREVCQSSNEGVYNYSLSMLKQSGADLLIVCTKSKRGEGEEYFYALADRKAVHVFKNKFNKLDSQNKILMTNSALFHLFKKLKQNDFAF